MTGVDVLAEIERRPSPDASIRRDRWGRYVIPHPHTGKSQSWTRATTLAGTLADRYGLERWDQRNVVLGIAARHDLYAKAAACTETDRDQLDAIVAEAKEASKSKSGANLGTALHRFTERIDAGEADVTVPPPWDADVGAYQTAMQAAGIGVVDGWIERVLVVPEIEVAGTCDRLVNALGYQLPRIGDLKTGKTLHYSWVEIALQLAIYAHAETWWDPTTETHHDMPKIDRDLAVVMHVPVGRGTCTLYEVDIAAGWDAVQLALGVRAWRKRTDLAQIIPAIGPAIDPEPLSVDRVAWARQRVAAIVETLAGRSLTRPWPTDVPTFKAADATGHTHSGDEVDAIATWCNAVEADLQVPFGPEDPVAAQGRAREREQQRESVEPPVVPHAPAAPDTTWADKGRALRSLISDDDLFRACAETARCADVTMTRERYLCLEAVVGQVADPTGAVQATYGARGCRVVPSDEYAAVRMAEAAGGKSHALHRAKRLAKRLGVPSPRSLAVAAADPLLAALVAAGHGVANPDDTTNSTTQESDQR